MTDNLRNIIATILAGGLAITPALADARPIVPVDPEIAGKTAEAIRAANQEGNYSVALREGRRLLELYPNNPELQAPIYLVMGEAAQKAGDAAQGADFIATAKAIDPKIEIRLDQGPSGAAKRGDDKGSKWQTALTMLAQGAQMAQQMQQQMQQQKMLRQQQMQAQQIQAQQMQAQQMQAQQMQQPAMAYPPAPVNAANYQPNPAMNGPMPGWDPQQQQLLQQQAQYQQQPAGQPQYPPQQAQYPPQPGQPQYPQPGQPQYPPQQAQVQYPPQQTGQPQYPPPGQPQYPPQQAQMQYPPQQTGQPQYPPQQAQYPPQPGQPQYPPQQPQYPPAQQAQYAAQAAMPQYPSQPNPYGAPNYPPASGQTRGEKPVVIKVVHDHYRAGDKAYFETSCGALLSVDGSNLTFTASGGEAPVVIPAGDILEIRLNTTVGRTAGAFHIATKKGLYLNLVPESGSRDDGRADIDQLRKQLGLGE